MKSFILIALLAVVANAAYIELRTVSPAAQAKNVAILKALNEADEDGGFNYNFESEDDIKVEVTGMQRQVGPKSEDVGTVQRGSYSYVAPDGTPITMSWTADENGFRPVGSHLPVAPPMPDYVVKMLADMKTQQQVYVTEVKAAPAPQVYVQEVKKAAAPQVTYVQQETKAAPAPQVTYVQQETKAAPAPQVTYVQEVVKAAPPQVTYVQQETKAAPAPHVHYVQQEVKASPAPQMFIQEVAAPARQQLINVVKTEEVPATQQVYVIQQTEEVRSTPSVQQVYVTEEVVPQVIRTTKPSSSGRQLFRVTFPESASK